MLIIIPKFASFIGIDILKITSVVDLLETFNVKIELKSNNFLDYPFNRMRWSWFPSWKLKL